MTVAVCQKSEQSRPAHGKLIIAVLVQHYIKVHGINGVSVTLHNVYDGKDGIVDVHVLARIGIIVVLNGNGISQLILGKHHAVSVIYSPARGSECLFSFYFQGEIILIRLTIHYLEHEQSVYYKQHQNTKDSSEYEYP